MNINIYLNAVEEDMLIALNKADGLKLTNEEYAQRLFSSALWVEHHQLYLKNKDKREER